MATPAPAWEEMMSTAVATLVLPVVLACLEETTSTAAATPTADGLGEIPRILTAFVTLEPFFSIAYLADLFSLLVVLDRTNIARETPAVV